MTAEELDSVRRRWGLDAAQLAKVLCLHSTKVSEYLGEVARIPCAVAYSIEALELLPDAQRQALFEKRLARPTHGGSRS